MAGFVELKIDQGAQYNSVIQLTDSTGASMNLVGFTANSQIRKTWTSETYYPFTVTFTDAANGEITLSMSSALTATLTPKRHVFDLQLIGTDGEAQRILNGVVIVDPSVTR